MDYKKLRDTRNSSNPFAQRLGIFVEEIGPGYARAVKDITAEDANPVGVAHGGCYFSLADTACGSAMASHGYYAVTVNASYNFLRSAKLGDHLVAEARETKPLLLRGGDPGPGGDAAGEWILHLLQAGPGDPAVKSAYKKTALRRSFCMLIS